MILEFIKSALAVSVLGFLLGFFGFLGVSTLQYVVMRYILLGG